MLLDDSIREGFHRYRSNSGRQIVCPGSVSMELIASTTFITSVDTNGQHRQFQLWSRRR